jgi:hypothetical protein
VADNFPELPGAEELEDDGFRQLWLLPITWSGVWRVWPAEHYRALPETRDAFWWPQPSRGSGPTCHFIRSPWDSVSLEDLLALMRVRVIRHPDWETNEQRGAAVAREVLSWDERRVGQEVSSLRQSRREG